MNNESSKGNRIFSIVLYLVFCVAVIVISNNISRKQVKENNLLLMNNTIGLMAEKINNSISVMIGYVDEASAMLTSHSDLDLEQRYYDIHNNTDVKLPYMSLGFVDTNGKVYGTYGEVHDIEKYKFYWQARKADGVYITQPYRATGSGTNVITMFGSIYQQGEYNGSVFVTYSLDQVQSYANTGILENDAEIFLMNCFSGNYIRCTQTDKYAAGSWNNLMFEKGGMECINNYTIDDWQNEMCSGENNSSVFFNMDGVDYIQSFQKINGMENWFVVVRVPSSKLAKGMNDNMRVMFFTLAILLVGTLLLALSLIYDEMLQKKQLQIISSHDPLTKAMNRRAYYTEVHDYFIKKGSNKRCALIFFDMDDFKPVNDKYGHDAGDKMLKEFSARLDLIFGKDGYVVRMGGDEFVVFLKNVPSREYVDKLIADFRKKLQGVDIPGAAVFDVKCSIGVAMSPNDTKNFEELEKYADRALYYVKNNGKNKTCWYSEIKN